MACPPFAAWILPLLPFLCVLAMLSPGNVLAGWFLFTHIDSPSVGLHHGQRPGPAPPRQPGAFSWALTADRIMWLAKACWSIQRGKCSAIVLCTPLQQVGLGGRGGGGAAQSGCG